MTRTVRRSERVGSDQIVARANGSPEDARTARRVRRPIGRNASLVAAVAVGFCSLMVAGIAAASTTVPSSGLVVAFPMGHIFTFLFLMLGPFKIIGPFVKLTKGAEASLERNIALMSIVFSCVILLIAGLLGEFILRKYNIQLPILALAAGIILFLVALQDTIRQVPPEPAHADESANSTPTLSTAMKPLAFPVIVTPQGIAALVVFLAFAPDTQSQLTIGAIVLAIMLLNLLAMIFARRILSILGVALAIVGTVLGVVQIALGLQIIHNSLKVLGAG